MRLDCFRGLPFFDNREMIRPHRVLRSAQSWQILPLTPSLIRFRSAIPRMSAPPGMRHRFYKGAACSSSREYERAGS